jgi:hypothetical protein
MVRIHNKKKQERLDLYTFLSLNTILSVRQAKLKDVNDLPDWMQGL